LSGAFHDPPVEDQRLGRLLRAVRQRRGLRQSDVAARADVSQSAVSRLERGRLDTTTIGAVRRVARELDVSVTLRADWRGGQGDRLLDRAHAALVDRTVAVLTPLGWHVVPEYMFNHFGDRGSVDILAWRADQESLLVIEVKATLTDLQQTLASLSRKARVLPDLTRREHGWRARHVAVVLVVAGMTANRSVIAGHAATFASAFPGRSRAVQAWLRSPAGSISGLWFVSASLLRSTNAGAVVRVRPPRA
jgi:transcriptional regulator with XRE-family HTH domain